MDDDEALAEAKCACKNKGVTGALSGSLPGLGVCMCARVVLAGLLGVLGAVRGNVDDETGRRWWVGESGVCRC